MKFKTTSSEYGSNWASVSVPSIKAAAVPTFGEINANKAKMRNLKSQILRDQGRAAAKILATNDRALRTQPFEPERYRIPEPFLKSASLAYTTTSSGYGQLPPTQADMPFCFAPKRSAFAHSVGPRPRNGLVTSVTRSRVNDILEYM